MTNCFLPIIKASPLFFLLTTAVVAQSNTDGNVDSSPSSQTKSGIQGKSEVVVVGPENSVTVPWGDRKKHLPHYKPLDPNRINDTDYVAEMWWEHLGYRSKEEAAKQLKKDKKTFEDAGLKWAPLSPGNPDYVEDYFTIPPREELDGCTYAQGYSYPGGCVDEKGKLIFDASVDGQEVLDKIVKKQGKLGQYNKMPKVKPKSTVSKTYYEDD